jgi:hypothetical protein
VPRSAIQLAVSRLGGGALAAFAAAPGASGKKACEKLPTRPPTAIPTAMVTLMTVTSACSATPATGISVKTTTRSMVSGLPVRMPKKNSAYRIDAGQQHPASA